MRQLLLGNVSAQRHVSSYDDVETPGMYDPRCHMVLDADFSQYSVIMDVAQGKNVAIEGPPGSGKSQTIVNVIASALGAGKKVLFVAEKLTALNVVKNRLDACGLGDFILPLQPRKDTKQRIYEALKKRLDLHVSPHDEPEVSLKDEQELIEERCHQVKRYLDVLRQDFGETKKSVYEVIADSVGASQVCEDLPKNVKRLRIPQSSHLTSKKIDDMLLMTRDFAQRLQESYSIPAFWRLCHVSVHHPAAAEDLAESVKDVIHGWEVYLREVRSSSVSALFLGGGVGAETKAGRSIEDLAPYMECFEDLSQHGVEVDAEDIARLMDSDHRRLLRDHVKWVRERKQLLANIQAKTHQGPLDFDRFQVSFHEIEEKAQKVLEGGDVEQHMQQRQKSMHELQAKLVEAQELLRCLEGLPRRWLERGSLQRLVRELGKITSWRHHAHQTADGPSSSPS